MAARSRQLRTLCTIGVLGLVLWVVSTAGDLQADVAALEKELGVVEELYKDLLQKATNQAKEEPKKSPAPTATPDQASAPSVDCHTSTDGTLTNAQIFARNMVASERACDALLGFTLVDKLRESQRSVCKDGGTSAMVCYEHAGMSMCQGSNIALVNGEVQASCSEAPDGKAVTTRLEGPGASVTFSSSLLPSSKETLEGPTLVLHPGLVKAEKDKPCEIIGGLLNAFVLLEVVGVPVESVAAVYVSDGSQRAENIATFLWNKIFVGAQPMKLLSGNGSTLGLQNGLFPSPASQSFMCSQKMESGGCGASHLLQAFTRIARKRVGVLSHTLPPTVPVKGKTVVAVVVDSSSASPGGVELAERTFNAVKQRANADTTEVVKIEWRDTANQIRELRRVHVMVAIDGVPALLSPFLADESSVLLVRCHEHFQDYRALVRWMERPFLHHDDEGNEKALIDKVDTLVRASRNYYNFLGNGCGLDCSRL